jgi:hypothetical protein
MQVKNCLFLPSGLLRIIRLLTIWGENHRWGGMKSALIGVADDRAEGLLSLFWICRQKICLVNEKYVKIFIAFMLAKTPLHRYSKRGSAKDGLFHNRLKCGLNFFLL